MMYLQEAPAETFNYMAFGFTVILGTMGLYILSLINRFRNVERDMELLDQLNTKAEPSMEQA
jgi:formylmethanofuran dehydrogenase subunit B